MKVVILCAGYATRLYPLTENMTLLLIRVLGVEVRLLLPIA